MNEQPDRHPVVALLSAARTRIARGGFAQGADARDKRGKAVWVNDGRAVAFSATGALFIEGCEFDGTDFEAAVRAFAEAVGVNLADFAGLCQGVWEWEDQATKADVYGAFARAMEGVE